MNGHALAISRKVREPKDVFALTKTKRIKDHVLLAIHLSRHLVTKMVQMVPDGRGCGSFDTSKIVQESLLRKSDGIVLAHNHLNETTAQPNKEDIKFTKILIHVGRLTGAHIVDHVIFGKSGYYSFKEHGRLFKKGKNYSFRSPRRVFRLCGR